MRAIRQVNGNLVQRFAMCAFFVMLVGGQDAWACAACGGVLSKEWEIQGITSKPGFSADLSYDYLNQNRQRYGSAKATGALINQLLANTQEIEAYTRTHTLTASLNYTGETISLSVQIPVVSRTHGTYGATAPLGSTYLASSDNSIGDVRVIGRYSGFSDDHSTGLIAGIKLPTGNIGAKFSDGVTALDAGLQIGTGSTDIIFGGYTSGTIDQFGWFAQGTVQHAVATDRAMGGMSYRPGDAYTLNSGIRYAEFGAKITPMLQLNVIRRQVDTGTGVPLDMLTGIPGVAISGGTLAYIAPGVSVRVGGGMSLYGFLQLPIYQAVNSLQITPQTILTLGVRKSFE